jgi:trans-aconitate methyltransferase
MHATCDRAVVIVLFFLLLLIIAKWGAGVDRYMAEKPRTQQTMEQYYQLLRPLSLYVDCWKVEYMHVLLANSNTTVAGTPSHPVYEWVKGTSMAPIIAALPTRESKIAFETSYIKKLEKAYPIYPADAQHKHPWTLFPFHRLFIIAVAK